MNSWLKLTSLLLSARGEALNAKPPAKRESSETYVDAFALPHPLPKKVRSSVVASLRVLPCIVLALRTMKDDALAPINCAVSMRPLPGPEVSDNQVQVTLSMGIEALVDATVEPDSQIEPMSTCLDSLTLISNGEHIEASLGRHNDFIGQLTVSLIIVYPLLRILVAVLMDMQEIQRREDSIGIYCTSDFRIGNRARDTEVRDGLVTKKSSRCRYLG
nr:hypothetical protein CFP56_18613 [Quercus suber]